MFNGKLVAQPVVEWKQVCYLSTTATATVLNVVETCDGSKWLVQLLRSEHPTMVNEGLLAISVVCSHVKVGSGVGTERLQGTTLVEDLLGLLASMKESTTQEMLCNALGLVLHLCQQGESMGVGRGGEGRQWRGWCVQEAVGEGWGKAEEVGWGNDLKDDHRKKGRIT